jgi:hypothetical protein
MKPTRVILHCSATSDSGDKIGASDISQWHRGKGFTQIGYHYVVRRSGVVELGRPDSVIGAHAKGNNHDSLGVCYIGTKAPTVAQIRSLLELYMEIHGQHKIPWTQWFGHSDVKNTNCPGFSMDAFKLLLGLYHEGDINSDEQIETFLQVIA